MSNSNEEQVRQSNGPTSLTGKILALVVLSVAIGMGLAGFGIGVLNMRTVTSVQTVSQTLTVVSQNYITTIQTQTQIQVQSQTTTQTVQGYQSPYYGCSYGSYCYGNNQYPCYYGGYNCPYNSYQVSVYGLILSTTLMQDQTGCYIGLTNMPSGYIGTWQTVYGYASYSGQSTCPYESISVTSVS